MSLTAIPIYVYDKPASHKLGPACGEQLSFLPNSPHGTFEEKTSTSSQYRCTHLFRYPLRMAEVGTGSLGFGISGKRSAGAQKILFTASKAFSRGLQMTQKRVAEAVASSNTFSAVCYLWSELSWKSRFPLALNILSHFLNLLKMTGKENTKPSLFFFQRWPFPIPAKHVKEKTSKPTTKIFKTKNRVEFDKKNYQDPQFGMQAFCYSEPLPKSIPHWGSWCKTSKKIKQTYIYIYIS